MLQIFLLRVAYLLNVFIVPFLLPSLFHPDFCFWSRKNHLCWLGKRWLVHWGLYLPQKLCLERPFSFIHMICEVFLPRGSFQWWLSAPALKTGAKKPSKLKSFRSSAPLTLCPKVFKASAGHGQPLLLGPASGTALKSIPCGTLRSPSSLPPWERGAEKTVSSTLRLSCRD